MMLVILLPIRGSLPEAVDEPHVECGVVITQPSEETQADTDPEEPPFVGSNKTLLNEEPVCGSVGVGDAAADTGFISGVDSQPIATGFTLDVDPSFVNSESHSTAHTGPTHSCCVNLSLTVITSTFTSM
jgi:hypothetical protein